jgi:hypothetical protein
LGWSVNLNVFDVVLLFQKICTLLLNLWDTLHFLNKLRQHYAICGHHVKWHWSATPKNLFFRIVFCTFVHFGCCVTYFWFSRKILFPSWRTVLHMQFCLAFCEHYIWLPPEAKICGIHQKFHTIFSIPVVDRKLQCDVLSIGV